MLEEIASAVERLSAALASLEAAYELLDERSQDRLEEDLFRPTQRAFGRLQRTYSEFGSRTGIATRPFAPGSSGMHAHSPRPLIDRAVDAAREADEILAELQDSLVPVEVGDPELRAGLADVRSTLAVIPDRAHDLTRVLGR
jgi:hypothetical protein